MSQPLSSTQRFLLTLAGVILGGYLIYLGVSSSAPDDPAGLKSSPPPPADSLAFYKWSERTFDYAQADSRLILLMVTELLQDASQAMQDSVRADARVRSWLVRRFVPIFVDRQHRPDIAERYAEGRAPFASVLLPGGEALTTLSLTPSEWPEKLAETYGYWQDHRGDIQERTVEFWEEAEAQAAKHRTPRSPNTADVDLVLAAVIRHFDSVLQLNDPGPTIWRSDTWQLLRAASATARTGDDRAGSILRQLTNARMERWPTDSVEGIETISTVTDWVEAHGAVALLSLAYDSVDAPDARLRQAKLRGVLRAGLGTYHGKSSEFLALFARLIRQNDWPLWVDYRTGVLERDGDTACLMPHATSAYNAPPLCFYLTDVIAWLETLLSHPASGQPDVEDAPMLADRAWERLWSVSAQAFRDKPLDSIPVREIEVFPRAQLGRMARVCWLLWEQTEDDKWLQRGDSCLNAFAPYAEEAGIAAAYYALALLEHPGRKVSD